MASLSGVNLSCSLECVGSPAHGLSTRLVWFIHLVASGFSAARQDKCPRATTFQASACVYVCYCLLDQSESPRQAQSLGSVEDDNKRAWTLWGPLLQQPPQTSRNRKLQRAHQVDSTPLQHAAAASQLSIPWGNGGQITRILFYLSSFTERKLTCHCKLKMYNMMVWYMNISWNIFHKWG